MRGSRNFRQGGGGGGGGGSGPSVIKIPDNVFIVLFLVVLHLFYRIPTVYFKEENYNFPRFQRGSNSFSRGGGGVQLFLWGGGGGGVQLLIPY